MKDIEYKKIFLDETKKGKKIKKENYLKEGKFPIIDQGREKIAGYCNKEDGIYTEQPVIIFGDHTRILKYIDFPFFLGADGVKILKVKNKNFLVKYLYYALLNYHIPNTGYNRHFKWLKNFKIKEIELQKQEKIILTLDKINSILKKQKEQLELLENLKKSQFFEMFGDPIKNEKGWDKVKLEKICDVRDGTHDSPKYILEGYPLVTSKNIINDSISFENVNYISETDYQNINKRSKVEYGDILMPMIGTIGKPIIVKIEDRFAIKNLALIKFYEGTKVLNIYVKSLLESNFLEIEIQKNKRGGTQKFIALKDIRNLKIPLPPLELQNKFATQIEAIQKLKFEIEKSLKETENLYNSLMQKFFSNK